MRIASARWNHPYLILAAFVLGGCFGGSAPKGTEIMMPRYHAWDSLTERGSEQKGYSLYTYVFINGNTNLKTDEGKRNEALLKAITEPLAEEGEPAFGPGETSGVLRRDCNIFYIPLTQKILPEFASALSLYNLPLAQQLASELARLIQNNYELGQLLLFGSGPYLVSLPVPLSEMRYRPARILVADLTETKPKSMGQVVAGFRRPQAPNPTDDLDRFRLIRLALLDTVLPLRSLTVENSIPLAAVPYGEGEYPAQE